MPGDVLRDIDKLVRVLKNDPKLRASGRVTRSTILRLAVIRGIEVLVAENRKELKGT